MSRLFHAHYSLGETLDLERERLAIAMQSLRVAGATDAELSDAGGGLTFIDGKIHRIIAVYVENPKVKDPNRLVETQEDYDELMANLRAKGLDRKAVPAGVTK